jgi:MFS family permease
MAWVSAQRSGLLAGLVLTAVNLPRALLLLVGGAVSDRVGAWKVMIAGDGIMVVVTGALAAGVWAVGHPAWLLLASAFAIGLVDAFYLPPSGSMPRRLVPSRVLSRAMSARQLAAQFAGFVGAPLGGAIAAGAGLAAAALADSATFAVMVLVLIMLRPRTRADPVVALAGDGLWRRSVDGLRVAVGDRLLRIPLLLLVMAAGFLLPVSGLLLPVLGHQRGWSGGLVGLVVGALTLCTAAVALVIILRGAFPRPGLVTVAGIWIAATGVIGLTVATSPCWAIVAGAVVGVGNGLFTTHIAPLILGNSPPTHLARVQAVVVLAQSLPLLVTNNLLGSLSDSFGATSVLGGCAAVLAMSGLAAVSSPTLRRATLAG